MDLLVLFFHLFSVISNKRTHFYSKPMEVGFKLFIVSLLSKPLDLVASSLSFVLLFSTNTKIFEKSLFGHISCVHSNPIPLFTANAISFCLWYHALSTWQRFSNNSQMFQLWLMLYVHALNMMLSDPNSLMLS